MGMVVARRLVPLAAAAACCCGFVTFVFIGVGGRAANLLPETNMQFVCSAWLSHWSCYEHRLSEHAYCND